jgi:hypothetical protein
MTGKCVGVVVLLLASCAGQKPDVRADDMSAAQHREAAAREAAAADREANRYQPSATRPSPFGDPLGKDYLYAVTVYNPTEGHLAEAEAHRAHARAHARAAEFLDRFEEAECADFPAATRAACPLLGPVVRIDDVDGGVRVRFKDGVRVDAVIAHMRCHYAFARARAFDASLSCPLYVRGIEVRRALDSTAVEIVSADPKVIREIRTRSREEAIFVRGDTHPTEVKP